MQNANCTKTRLRIAAPAATPTGPDVELATRAGRLPKGMRSRNSALGNEISLPPIMVCLQVLDPERHQDGT